MTREHCPECGFDSDEWSDAAAVQAITQIPARWTEAVTGLSSAELQRRPISDMWSIAEYTDHVREVLFGIRFLLDVVTEAPETDLGDPPEPRFDPEPRVIDIDDALAGVESEAGQLHDRLSELPSPGWGATALVHGDTVDLHWLARHAVHDASHHLGDVSRLRRSL